MGPYRVALACLALTAWVGCATAVRPPELADAERAYARATNGPVSQYAAPDLEAARNALEEARRAYANHDVGAARDLAYIARRRVELAEARADETRDLDDAGVGTVSASSETPPPPPTPARRGIVIPSDVGLGTGPAGPSNNSGTAPAGAPPPGTPNGP
jgi:hypothetical protein